MKVRMGVLLLKVHFGYLSLVPDKPGKLVTWAHELSHQQHTAQTFLGAEKRANLIGLRWWHSSTGQLLRTLQTRPQVGPKPLSCCSGGLSWCSQCFSCLSCKVTNLMRNWRGYLSDLWQGNLNGLRSFIKGLCYPVNSLLWQR